MTPNVRLLAIVVANVCFFSACSYTPDPLKSVANAIQTSVAVTPVIPLEIDNSTPDALPHPTIETPSCVDDEEFTAFTSAISALLREWEDTLRVAETTPKITLPTQIVALQALRRQGEGIVVPSCALTIKPVLISAMNSSIDAMLDFASSATNADIVVGRIVQSRARIEAAKHALSVLAVQSAAVPPLTVEQIKEQYSAISWEETVLQNGNSALRWMQDPYVIEVQHDNGTVFSVTVSSMLFDPAETADIWDLLIDLALPFLHNWPGVEGQIKEFAEQPPSDRLPEPLTLREGTRTLELSHVYYEVLNQSLATITVILPTHE